MIKMSRGRGGSEIGSATPLPTPSHHSQIPGGAYGMAHLDVLAIMASSRQLDAPECDGALQGHLDGRLLHAVLPIESRVA